MTLQAPRPAPPPTAAGAAADRSLRRRCRHRRPLGAPATKRPMPLPPTRCRDGAEQNGIIDGSFQDRFDLAISTISHSVRACQVALSCLSSCCASQFPTLASEADLVLQGQKVVSLSTAVHNVKHCIQRHSGGQAEVRPGSSHSLVKCQLVAATAPLASSETASFSQTP